MLIILFIILVLLTICVLMMDMRCSGMEHFDECANQSPTADQIQALGQTAIDACNRISSRAEEIKAHYNGAKSIIDSAMTFLSPNNYRSGDNTSTDIMRNIINTNLSSCDINKIQMECVNSSVNVQTNSIDNSQCVYCQTHMCTIKNVTQENVARISQTCTLQSAISTLLKKTASVDSQALAKVMQEAQGILSGNNTFQKENCSIIAPDLSTAKYIEAKSSCINRLAIDQGNSIKFCGDVTDIVQKNQFDAYQKCLMDSIVVNESEFTDTTKITHQSEAEQKTTGVTPLSSGISCASCLICCICCCLLLSAAAGTAAYARFKMATQNK
jgi:hypothetical protein